MAAGCYCLSHCWEGSDEILPREFLFDTNLSLADKLKEYFAMEQGIRAKGGREMRSIVEKKFGIEQTTESILSAVCDVA
jgi:hypothetical protein